MKLIPEIVHYVKPSKCFWSTGKTAKKKIRKNRSTK